MELKRVLLTLLALSLVNIGLMMILLYRSSNWSGAYHSLVEFAISKLHSLDKQGSAQTHETDLILGGESFIRLTIKNNGSTSQMRTSRQEEVNEKAESNVKLTPMRLNQYWKRIEKSQPKQLPLNAYQKSLQALKRWRYRRFNRLNRGSLPQQIDYSQKRSSEPVTIRIENSSSTFIISENFTFPHFKCVLFDNRKMAKTQWVMDLANLMAKKSKEMTIFAVTVNEGYKESLFNWLISAILKGGVSLDRILVISLDVSIEKFLNHHNISCVFVPIQSLFDSARSRYLIDNYGLVMFTRVSVIRLLNHWGYSVVNVDTDALILRDPQPLFDKYPSSSIVASSGTQPRTLYSVWNTTICNGLILLRSNQEMGKLESIELIY